MVQLAVFLRREFRVARPHRCLLLRREFRVAHSHRRPLLLEESLLEEQGSPIHGGRLYRKWEQEDVRGISNGCC